MSKQDEAPMMKLTYTRISKEVIKLFYEEEGYGEVYLRLNPDGTAEFQMKDIEWTLPFAFGFIKMFQEAKANRKEIEDGQYN